MTTRPGETATFTASGFAVGETVEFEVLHIDSTPNTGLGHEPWQVTDGGAEDLDGVADGSVQTTWYVNEDDSANSVFEVTATGITSGHCGATEFSDSYWVTLIDESVSHVLSNVWDPNYLNVAPVYSSAAGWVLEFNSTYDLLRSKPLDLSDYLSINVSYIVRNTTTVWGGGNSPEADDHLYFRFRTAAGNSYSLLTHDIANTSSTSWTTVNYTFTEASKPGLFGSQRVFEFNAEESDRTWTGTGDYWFVDSILVRGLYNQYAPAVTLSGSSGNASESPTPSMSWSTSDSDGNLSSVSASVKNLTTGKTVASWTSTNGTFVPTSLGEYRLTVTATDSRGRQTTKTRSFNWQDDDTTPPTITVTPEEGNQAAAADQVFSWSVDDASGSSSDVIITKDAEQIFSRSYTENVSEDSFDFNEYGLGNYQITIAAIDNDTDRTGDQLSSTESRIVNVINTDPCPSLTVTTPAAERNEGSPLIFDASGSTDPDGDSLTYVWNFGDGTLALGATPVHVYGDDGNFDVTLTVVDCFGGVAKLTQPITIQNVAPTLEVTAPTSVSEAAPVVVETAVSDPGDDNTTILIDWGDGSTDTYGLADPKQHIYAEGGQQHTIRVDLVDEDGLYPDLYNGTINVLDAPPLVTSFPAFLTSQAGQAVQFNTTVVDGLNDTLTFAWSFGDGQSIAGSDLTTGLACIR